MKKEFYFDMDGVLADFNKERGAVARFKYEQGFFTRLKPVKKHVKLAKKLIAKGYEVFVISASPHIKADRDKKQWLTEHLPELSKRNIIIVRIGENKADYVRDMGNSVLFDDYGKNVRQWQANGGKAYKVKASKKIKLKKVLA